MKRRDFIGNLAVGGLLGAASLATSCSRSPTTKEGAGSARARTVHAWRLVLAVPKTLPIWGPGLEAFAERVRRMSEDRLRIRVYGANELVPGLQVFDAVQAGQVELGHAAAYYWEGKIPGASFFTSVPFGMTAPGMAAWIHHGGGQALWDELYAPFGVLGLPCGNTGVQMGGWFRREIRSIADFKGLKMRIPGLGGKVMAKAGAEPVLTAGGEIFTSLQTGVLDATEWIGPYHDYTMGLPKVAKYYYAGGWHEPGSVLELLINRAKWEALPVDLQQIVLAAAAMADRDMAAQWTALDAEYMARIVAEGRNEVREFPLDVLRALREHAAVVKRELRDTSSLVGRIYDSYTTFQERVQQYQEYSDLAYVRARKA